MSEHDNGHENQALVCKRIGTKRYRRANGINSMYMDRGPRSMVKYVRVWLKCTLESVLKRGKGLLWV